MIYSNKEMRAIILELAETAGPQEAEALRSIAQNYTSVTDNQPRTRFGLVLLLVAGVCMFFWLSVYLLATSLPPLETPKGEIAERISNFEMASDGRFQARTYRFSRTEAYRSDPAPLAVYEDATPLSPGNYEIDTLAPQNVWRFVRLKTSDGSDPNTNGRRYYMVLPSR